jgi:hypothetical protein
MRRRTPRARTKRSLNRSPCSMLSIRMKCR